MCASELRSVPSVTVSQKLSVLCLGRSRSPIPRWTQLREARWPAQGVRRLRALSLRQSLEGGQVFRNLVKGLLVDGVDRHLRRPENTLIIERADLQDHSLQTKPTGQDRPGSFAAGVTAEG